MLIILFLAFMSLTPGMLLAENLDSLPEAKRNARLLEIAKQTVMKHGPGYYRDVYPPVIVHEFVTFDKSKFSRERDKQHAGRSYYMVEYPYDESQESFDWGYAVQTYIWGDTGVPFRLGFGNGSLLSIESTTRSSNEKELVMPFKKQPPYEQNK